MCYRQGMSDSPADSKELTFALTPDPARPGVKSGSCGRIDFVRREGNDVGLWISGVQISLLKDAPGHAFLSAHWSAHAESNYCSPNDGYPTRLVVSLMYGPVSLATIDLGPWSCICHTADDQVFNRDQFPIDPRDFDRADAIRILPMHVMSAAC